MSAIVAFSDVHLGYERSDSEAFGEFVRTLQTRNDLADVVIIGDLIDLWRRDVIGLEFVLSKHVEELKTLQEKANVHYLYGNHDAHVQHLKQHGYPFQVQESIAMERFGYTFRFLHGHQCDPLQNIFGPGTSELLCWTLSDDIGGKKSALWDLLTLKRAGVSREVFEANFDSLTSPPQDRRRTAKFGGLSDFLTCVRAYLKITGEKEFIVFGHTHKPFIDLEKRVANTGYWEKEAPDANTYLEITGWPPRLLTFGGAELRPTSRSTLV
jgi:UDP-2,3-diacylglucosamine pyrophosphatase LpxH